MFLVQDDNTLIEKALKGNQNAWKKLVKRHEKALYGYTLRMTGNPSDAMDLMQETFLAVCRNLPDFRHQSTFKTWMFSLAYYRCMDFYRRKKLALAEDQEPDAIEDQEQTFCPTENLQQLQTQQGLIDAVAKLTAEQKQIVEMKIFQQQTFDDVAMQLGLSTNTVKSRFYAAINRLKTIIGSNEYAA